MEKSLLACMILDPDVIKVVSTIVTREDFTSETNRQIYDIVMELSSDDKKVDLISIYKRAIEKGIEDDVKAVYLAQLCDDVIIPYPVTVSWMLVAKRQREAGRRARLKLIKGKKDA